MPHTVEKSNPVAPPTQSPEEQKVVFLLKLTPVLPSNVPAVPSVLVALPEVLTSQKLLVTVLPDSTKLTNPFTKPDPLATSVPSLKATRHILYELLMLGPA